MRSIPHSAAILLTTRLKRVEKGLSWSWRRWNDENGDQRVGDGEIGHALRRMQTASGIAAIIRRDDRAD